MGTLAAIREQRRLTRLHERSGDAPYWRAIGSDALRLDPS